MLARLLFGITAGTHFLFVALTLGLAAMIAIMQTRAVVSDSAVHLRMVRFWGQLYVINYAVGIVTGLLMEFQFGLSWPGLADHAGSVFGAPLAMETLVAFFVEATFLGLWIFGWDRLNRYAHLALIWIVTITAYASAYFILVANGFLRNPVGYFRAGQDLRVDSAGRLFTNPAALLPLGHIAAAAFLIAGLLMAGVSGWHLRNTGDDEVHRRSLTYGLVAIVAAIVPSVLFGAFQFPYAHDGESRPVIAAIALEVMMTAWVWLFGIAVVALVKLLRRRRPPSGRFFFPLLLRSIGVAYLAVLTGWIAREGGRQPWLIYHVLRTEDAVRPMSAVAMGSVTAAITALFLALVVVNFRLLRKYARLGPDGSLLGGTPPADALDPVPSF